MLPVLTYKNTLSKLCQSFKNTNYTITDPTLSFSCESIHKEHFPSSDYFSYLHSASPRAMSNIESHFTLLNKRILTRPSKWRPATRTSHLQLIWGLKFANFYLLFYVTSTKNNEIEHCYFCSRIVCKFLQTLFVSS